MQRMHFKPRRHCYDHLFLIFCKRYAVRLFWTQFCFKAIAQSELFLIKRYPAIFTGSNVQPSSSQRDRGSLSRFSHFYSHSFFPSISPFQICNLCFDFHHFMCLLPLFAIWGLQDLLDSHVQPVSTMTYTSLLELLTSRESKSVPCPHLVNQAPICHF